MENSTPQKDIEQARLELERERFEWEKTKNSNTNKFFDKYSAILIPAAVAFAAVVVSLGQVWVTKITKEKELELTAVHRQQENERLRSQRKRELDISAANFVSANRKVIFDGNPKEKELYGRLITTIFPLEVSAPLLSRLERISAPDSKGTWQGVLKTTTSGNKSFSPDGNSFITIDRNSVSVWDVNSGLRLMSLFVDEHIQRAEYSPDGSKILTQSFDGESILWDLSTGERISTTQD